MMTGLQKDVLEIVLKSQLSIEIAVSNRLTEMKALYDTNNVNDLLSITNTKISEIKRQLKEIQ